MNPIFQNSLHIRNYMYFNETRSTPRQMILLFFIVFVFILLIGEAGDLFIFPSNFMYPHQAKVVHSGTKYSLVTMLDYSSKFHTPEMYQETGS